MWYSKEEMNSKNLPGIGREREREKDGGALLVENREKGEATHEIAFIQFSLGSKENQFVLLDFFFLTGKNLTFQ